MKTQFNPDNKTELTYGQILDPAMKITEEEDAKQYLESYISYLIPYVIDNNKDKDDIFIYEESVKIAKYNLGYYAGYFDNSTRERVERLFNCSHPIFGSIATNGTPSAQEAFNLGKSLALKKIREVKLEKINKINNSK